MNYTATFTYHSDVMPGVGSNRSRIDSETSGSSESSRGSGKPRRRSHRPRGCRGGSNRRRNNSTDDKGNKRTNNNNNNNNSGNSASVVVNENSRKTDNVKPPNKGTKQTHHQQQHVNNPLHNISILSKRTKHFYADSSNKFEQDNKAYSANTTRTEYPLPAEAYDMLSFHNNNFDYPVIQPSFSDSSSEGVPDPRVFERPRPMARNMDGSLILPPLPANAFYSEPVPSGPNPYALKTDSHEHFQHQQQQQHGHYEPRMYSSSFMPANSHCGTNNMSTNTNNNSNSNGNNFIQPHQQHYPNVMSLRIHTENTVVAPPPMQQNYKAARLEKQRQNVVGGSLFATSPRSFLFGLSKSDIPVSGSA